MFSLLLGILIGALVAVPLVYFINIGFAIFIAVFIVALVFFFITRKVTKQLQTIFNEANTEVQKQHYDAAITTMKGGYQFANWAFLVRAQVDSQIGTILYIQKKFGEAYKYLQKSNPRIYSAYTMLIVGHWKNKKIDKLKQDMDLLVKVNKKEPFVYSFAAYMYGEQLNDKNEALAYLKKGTKLLPSNQNLKDHLLALQNNKKFKMEKWGDVWYQLMIEKKSLSRLQNKMMKQQQKGMKVKNRAR
ncbi:hypothetical protein KAH37_05620 [bacterium]|nr:hypothetical protein [bacterium]